MARIRTIKPEFFTSLSVADLTPERRLTFIGLWTHVDDEGRCVDDPRLIKAALWPLDDRTAADVEADLSALSEASLITRYTLNHRRYLAVTNWGEHQRINRPTASKLPPPQDGIPTPPTSKDEPAGRPHTQFTEDSLPERNREQGTGKGKERGKEGATPPSSEIAPRPSDAAPDRPEIQQICNHLADRIEANGSKRPTVTKKWLDACRLMLDRDGRTVEQVRGAIDWSQNDEFWRRNILSMPKLREQYDRLRLQAESQRAGRAPVIKPSTTDLRVADIQQRKADKYGGEPTSIAEIFRRTGHQAQTIPGELA